MEYSRVLVDTSIIIDHLRKKDKKKSFLYGIMKKYEVFISSVTEFELFAGATNSEKKKDVKKILDLCEILPFSSEIARVSADIYKELKSKNQIIEIRDLFIAATAEENGLKIATLNKKHFARITSIKLLSIKK